MILIRILINLIIVPSNSLVLLMKILVIGEVLDDINMIILNRILELLRNMMKCRMRNSYLKRPS